MAIDMCELHGRTEICTAVDEITRENLVEVLNNALTVHRANSTQIDYLYNYMRGKQPILSRVKVVRPEICNKVVENHASEIAQFTSGYFMGEPVTYVRRGDNDGSSESVNILNEYMFDEDKSSHDKQMATWMAICGVGYRMVLPDRGITDEDNSPFELDTPDPRSTFIVYHSGFGHHRMMGVQDIVRVDGDGHRKHVYCGYTASRYFEVEDGKVMKWEPHALGDIPIFEYQLNMSRMGSFEPAIPLLDAINAVTSNRLDGLETFVQSFLKFINCEVDEEKIKSLSHLGAIKIKSVDGMNGDVQLISQELNQEQTQTLIDYLYDQVLTICGLPTTTKGGSSTSDTGQAVFLRDGWSQCEARAKDTEQLFKRSERKFLKLVLRIIKDTRGVDLKLAEIECKFTRRQHDNLLTKAQTLITILEAGVSPEVAIATCGLFNDPMDVSQRSKAYMQKWEFIPIAEEEPMSSKNSTNVNNEVAV